MISKYIALFLFLLAFFILIVKLASIEERVDIISDYVQNEMREDVINDIIELLRSGVSEEMISSIAMGMDDTQEVIKDLIEEAKRRIENTVLP